MSLWNIVSTFMCVGVFGFCSVSGSNSLYWNDDLRNAQYELKLSEPDSRQGQYHIVCNMTKRGYIHCTRGMNYEITSNKWLSNENYIRTFLITLKDIIVNLGGSFPNFDLVNNFANSLEQLFESSKSKDCKSQSNDSGSLDDCVRQGVQDHIKDHINRIKNDENHGIKEINSTDDFLKLTKDDIEKLKRISFKRCLLNTNFSDHVDVACIGHIDTIEFIDCILDNGMQFAEILDSACNKHISIINCGLTDDDLVGVLRRMGSTSIDTMDLSNNLLTKDVISKLDKIIDGYGLGITSIKLYGNSIEKKDIAVWREGFYYV